MLHLQQLGSSLADGAQGPARRQPLVNALHVEAVLARQHPLLVAIPAYTQKFNV
jgi:hypothetical protein